MLAAFVWKATFLELGQKKKRWQTGKFLSNLLKWQDKSELKKCEQRALLKIVALVHGDFNFKILGIFKKRDSAHA